MKWLKRYVSLPLLIVVAFLAYLSFFNENSMARGLDLSLQSRSLQREIAAYEDTLQLYQQLNSRLDTDPRELERIVREVYHMQRPSEDVYVVVN